VPSVGRPREHNERTAVALLEAAERTVQVDGLGALSVRGVADQVGTTTRAIYSVFGSKEGLVIALGTRAFELLGAAITALPTTGDPVSDLVEAGAAVFRRFAIEHPSLFQIGVQLASPQSRHEFSATANKAFAGLEARITRVNDAGLLGPRTVRDAACEFHALCEGLAAVELRSQMTPGQEERIWRDALTALVTGFAAQPRPPRRRNPKAAPRHSSPTVTESRTTT
jgi:AcrR family transcriptional regulator